jgi:CheY-like chemotaxis protein
MAHVLLAEDNPGDARLITEFLKEGGFTGSLHWVTDGADALDFVFRVGKYVAAPSPDVLLLDLNLPKLDGKEVLRRINGSAKIKSIIVMTTSCREEDASECRKQGAHHFFTKPRDLVAFQRLIQWLVLVDFAHQNLS